MIIRLILPGTPPRKNDRHAPARGGRGLRNTPAYREVVTSFAAAWHGREPISSGRWGIRIAAFWPRVRHLDVDLPCGDIDAPISVIHDALEDAGVIDDDMRFAELSATKAVDREDPRVEIEIYELDT